MVNEALKAVVGMAKSKYSRMQTESAFARRMLKNIGGAGVLGEKNYNYYYRNLKKMANQGMHEEAKKYARREHIRVSNDE